MIRSFTTIAASAALSVVPPTGAGAFLEVSGNAVPFGGQVPNGQLFEGNRTAVRREDETPDLTGIDQYSPLPLDKVDSSSSRLEFARPTNQAIPKGLGWSAAKHLRKVPPHKFRGMNRDRRTGSF